jgi:hypothetical protein
MTKRHSAGASGEQTVASNQWLFFLPETFSRQIDQ